MPTAEIRYEKESQNGIDAIVPSGLAKVGSRLRSSRRHYARRVVVEAARIGTAAVYAVQSIATLEVLAPEQRSARLAEASVKILVGILNGVEPDEAGASREQAQMAVIAGLLGLLRKEYRAADVPSWPRPLSALRSIHRQSAPFLAPATGVLRPWLFTAGRADPSLLADLRAELDSADEVDILVSLWAPRRRGRCWRSRGCPA